MDSAVLNGGALTTERISAPAAVARLPWYCYALVVGIACIPIGVLWDISWHSTIGRDTFWTPAHIVTYLGGLIPGLTCGWIAIKTHFFGTPAERAAAVGFWWFRAPLGAWITIWGTFTMLLSAPFDDWWHNAYGLDVEILSPPHSVLALGMFAVGVGALLLLISEQNRNAQNTTLNGGQSTVLVIVMFGLLLTMASIFLTERSFPNLQHSSIFYRAACVTYPMYLLAAARGARVRWPATTAAAIYMGISLLMNWVLQLFPGEPKLAPIYTPLDRMVPAAFPVVLVAPAFAIDLALKFWPWRRSFWRDTLLALVVGLLFLGVLLAVQWHFSKFLLSPAADNWFFTGNRFWPYYTTPSKWRYEFWEHRHWVQAPVTWGKMGIVAVLGFLSSRAGLGLGNWLSKVQR